MTRLRELEQRIAGLTPEQRGELVELVSASPMALWAPTPGPQEMAYYCEAHELFFGGAAGGGKSSLIIGKALTRHRRCLILRKEATQLRGMIDDLARILKTRDGFSKQFGQWYIPKHLSPVLNDGLDPETGGYDGDEHLLEFSGVPDPGSEEKHQGIPHDLLAFDEVTQFQEYVVNYLSTWNRTTTPGQRCQVVLTSNPPLPGSMSPAAGGSRNTAGGLWLIRRYAPWLDPDYVGPVDPATGCPLPRAKPGELRWFATIEGKEREVVDNIPFVHEIELPDGTVGSEVIEPTSRTFIPSRVTDNPYLIRTSYVRNLMKLVEPIRSAMLYGDFTVALSDKPLQLIPAEWIRAANKRHRELPKHVTDELPQTTLGVDASRGGADNTVLAPRHGHWFAPLTVVSTIQAKTGPEVAAEVLKLRRSLSVVVVDANGVGASVYDHLTTNAGFMEGEDVIGHVGSRKSLRRDRSGRYGFANLRSEVYWRLREALDPMREHTIALPPDDELMEELTVLSWSEVGRGLIQVTPKDKVIEQLRRSPDKADAVAMTMRVEDEREEAGDGWMNQELHSHGLDPSSASSSSSLSSSSSSMVSHNRIPPRTTRTSWRLPASELPYNRD